jgi:hypothetical protein
MRVILATGLLVAMALAGCTDEPSEDQNFVAAVETGVAADLPPWDVGMWWEYETTVGVFKFIVTGETGDAYIVDTNDKNSAYIDATEDISFVGEIRKADLAGSQNGKPIVMFDWPLTEDKEWTTDWDGAKLKMVANAMGENQFHVMGHRDTDGQLMVEYHYNANVAWFEYIIFYGETGEETFRLSLRDSGFDFKGSYYRYTIGETLVFNVAPEESTVRDVPIAAQWNELNVTFVAICGDNTGYISMALNTPEDRDPNGVPMIPFASEPSYGYDHRCDTGPVGQQGDIIGNNGGNWEFGAIVSSNNGMLHLIIEQRHVELLSL